MRAFGLVGAFERVRMPPLLFLPPSHVLFSLTLTLRMLLLPTRFRVVVVLCGYQQSRTYFMTTWRNSSE